MVFFMMPTYAARSQESPSSNRFASLSEVSEWLMYSMCKADGQEEIKNTLAILASVRWLCCTRSQRASHPPPPGCRVGLCGHCRVTMVCILQLTVTVVWCPQTVEPVTDPIMASFLASSAWRCSDPKDRPSALILQAPCKHRLLLIKTNRTSGIGGHWNSIFT